MFGESQCIVKISGKLSHFEIFLYFQSFIVGEFTESMGVTSMQTCFAIPFCIIQMFMLYYVFDILHNKVI